MPERVDFGFDADTVSHYMTGMCHALALHKRTGWPMVAFWGFEGGEDCLAHIAVEHPDDPSWVVDVKGVRHLREVTESYYDLEEPWNELAFEDDLERWIDQEDRLHALTDEDFKVADQVAEQILARMRLEMPSQTEKPLAVRVRR